MSMGWFHSNVTWPVIQNSVASAVCGAALFFGSGVVSDLSGCSSGVINDVARGENLMLNGAAEEAKKVAVDAVVEAPHCGCAHALKAEANYALMRAAVAHHKPDLAESLRAECYADALLGGELLSVSPSVMSLRTSCKARQ